MIVIDAAFDTNSFGHGGERRSSQIKELIFKLNKKVAYVPKSYRKLRLVNLFHYFIIGIIFNLILIKNLSNYVKIKNIVKIGLIYWTLNHLRKSEPIELIIIEDTSVDNIYLIKIYKYFCKNIIALPHNIEAIDYFHKNGIKLKRTLYPNLLKEVKYLSLVNEVFCISREDSNLFNNLGLRANYLPYNPPLEVMMTLLKIRETRKLSDKTDYLILGSHVNPATKFGVYEMMLNLDKFQTSEIFKVVGFSSDSSKPNIISSKFEFLFNLSQLDLENIFCTTKGILLYQSTGTGALTRIVESKIMGIPIISNITAARNEYNSEGVYLYDDFIDMKELLVADLCEPELNLSNKIYESYFLSKIVTLLGDVN